MATSKGSRAIVLAHGRLLKGFDRAMESFANIPLMQESIDPRTHARRQREFHHPDVTNALQFEGSGSGSPTTKESQARPPVGPAIQSQKSRSSGKPEMPTIFEQGSSQDLSTPGEGMTGSYGG